MFNFLKTKLFLSKVFIVLIFGLLFISSKINVSASSISLEKTSNQISVSQVFRVDILLNTESKSINAFESSIFFDDSLLEAKKIYDGGSIVSYWIKKPKVQGNQIFFSGMTPGGISADNGKIVSIIFIAKKEGLAKIEFKNTKLLLNDGDATEDFININNLYLNIQKLEITNPADDGKGSNLENPDNKNPENIDNNQNPEEVIEEEDVTRPENFTAKIIKDKNINNGNFSLIFYAQDKTSGIDHYELREGDEEFREVTSPYLLKNQDLTKVIEVKAIDKSGNYRIEKIGPLVIKETKLQINYNIVIYSLLFSIFVLILVKIYLDKKHKKMSNGERNNKIE